MKVLIAISCLLAVASAGFIGSGLHHGVAPVAYTGAVGVGPVLSTATPVYGGPQHVPVIGPNGVPLEPAENVAARASHAASHAEAIVRNGDYAYGTYGAPLAYSGALTSAVVPAVGSIFAGPQHLPVIGPNGVPLEPAANVAARASHAASHAEAIVRNGDFAYGGHLAYSGALDGTVVSTAGSVYGGPQHLPVIGPNGVPLEPAANVAARASHAASHAEAIVRNGDFAYGGNLAYSGALHGTVVTAAGPVYAGPQHLPVIGPNGVPLEPAENVAARASHAASHVEAKARNGDLALAVSPVAYTASVSPVIAGVTPYTYGAFEHHAYVQHVSVIGPNGVPLEPAENVAARAEHAASHIEAKVRNGDIAVLPRKRRGILHEGVAAYSAALATPYAYGAHAYGAPLYGGPQHLPVIGPNGVPLEPAANVAARASHAAAHVEAVARNGDYAVAVAPAIVAHPGAVAVGVHPAATYPALAIDGQPLETPEVVATKSAHFAAHAVATARNLAGHVIAPLTYSGPHGYATPYGSGVLTHAGVVSHTGVPLDTPEVAIAKAAHFQAHINDKIAHGIIV